jgi:hypothetical protein
MRTFLNLIFYFSLKSGQKYKKGTDVLFIRKIPRVGTVIFEEKTMNFWRTFLSLPKEIYFC